LLTAAAIPAAMVFIGESTAPEFESLEPGSEETKMPLVSSPSMPSQFASTKPTSGRSVVEVAVHLYSQPLAGFLSRST
jgi:hypothetical protein